jgi:xanthine dehydrogenase accessory factor
LAAGISQQRLDEVYSPAGVHINAVTPEEIALSIMAEIVKVRRAKGRSEAIDG